MKDYEQLYTQGKENLLLSSIYALNDAQVALEKFDLNFPKDDEAQNYLDIVKQKLDQVQDLLELTKYFEQQSKYEEK